MKTMERNQYKIIQPGEPKAPPISLIVISGKREFTASAEAFGPGSFNKNIKKRWMKS